ncbi:hypothetical protein HIM_09327 [Hirsutella minnesotensis 3608]|uniref:Uncharacterized protein n=1 Tax=Hirsutella minnesotensis 3608 TaxID=1043627 RepID=A0A0F8A358_9HYPO|nr:hypothetical protein HIM_09327 [Hirsutella minnesotensis 3608]
MPPHSSLGHVNTKCSVAEHKVSGITQAISTTTVVDLKIAYSKEGEEYPPRYSIAYFCNPNFDSFIETLPGTYAADAEKKYTGVNSGEYLVQRLTATY